MKQLRQMEAYGKRIVGPKRAARLHAVADAAEISARTIGTSDGRSSARALTRYRNRFRGQRAVIIGNGPSLQETDLSLLRKEVTFGLNRVYMLFDDLGFQTTFLVAINELLISQVADELSDVSSQKFFRWSSRRRFSSSDSTAFLHSRRTPGFMTDARRGVWEGATVTYVAMQLAFHMGFSKVVLIGVDHRFSTDGPAHKVVESAGSDPNHFDPNYFGRGFRWQLPDLEVSEYAYRLARAKYISAGREIVDATVGGALEVFPKASLAEVLA